MWEERGWLLLSEEGERNKQYEGLTKSDKKILKERIFLCDSF